MKLIRAEIEGYRSVREKVELFVEPNVTVVLGPNDHGKTNLITALRHLNASGSFTDDDLNWDRSDSASTLPRVSGIYELSRSEREEILQEENERRRELNEQIAAAEEDEEEHDETVEEEATVAAAPTPPSTAAAAQRAAATAEEDDEYEDEEELPSEPLPELKIADIPEEIVVSRAGLESGLSIDIQHSEDELEGPVLNALLKRLPRVELISPFNKLSDSVSKEGVGAGENEFMRGIFYYAGLNPDDTANLFLQNDRTERTLKTASQKLNSTLRESWSQGEDLEFLLNHNSKSDTIELKIEDPAVESRFVRASRRSSGFTHYFSLKTILHSRQRDNPASSYILLFDEPGVFLHPSGQFDLLQVMETLAMESQVVYVTHSLFMINKTFPTRHRLIMKNEKGTKIDGKPYIGRWKSVTNALGFSLTGTILFARNVILTEGDSDPIYLYAILQKTVEAGKTKLDINGLSIMSTGESKNADVLIRLLLEANPRPKIAVITDGDKGGAARLSYLKKLISKHNIPKRELDDGLAIEDYVPMVEELFVPAVASYTASLVSLQTDNTPDAGEFETRFQEHFKKTIGNEDAKVNLVDWSQTAALEIGKLKSPPSKVGIAREYANRLLEMPAKDFKLDRKTTALIKWLKEKAGVPEFQPVGKKIVDGGDE